MAQLIHEWKPWERSTGPRTAEGKARVARNAWKGGVRPAVRRLARVLSEQLSLKESRRKGRVLVDLPRRIRHLVDD